VQTNANGTIDLVNLVGADKLDPGNYKPGLGAIRALFAATAAEFGDEPLRKEMLRQLDEEHHPVFETKTGALKNKGLSTIEQGAAMRGRLSGFQDWVGLVKEGPPENVLRGPILENVAFPNVLVAKCYSHDGDSLDLVVYPGKEAGDFELGFTRLRPGETYTLAGKSVVAGKTGEASFRVAVDGRTEMKLLPQTLN
jgi:Linalool dehydratase/isomerase